MVILRLGSDLDHEVEDLEEFGEETDEELLEVKEKGIPAIM